MVTALIDCATVNSLLNKKSSHLEIDEIHTLNKQIMEEYTIAIAESNSGYIVGQVNESHSLTVRDAALIHYPETIQLSSKNLKTLKSGELVYVVPDSYLLNNKDL